MASDGPSKPLVPPPPQLSSTSSAGSGGDAKPTSTDDDGWLALLEDDPKDDPEEAATLAQSPSERDPLPEEDVASAEPEVLAEDELVAVAPPAPPPPRRGVLPPPRSEGKRVQPLAAHARSKPPERPSAAGLPSGLRPPGAPEAREREDTDVLIASAVAALTHEAAPQTAEDSAVAPVGSAAQAPSGAVAAAVPPSPDAAAEAEDRRIPPLWIGLGVAAAGLLLLLVFTRGLGSGDEPSSEDRSSAAAVVADAEPAAPTPEPEPVVTPAPDLPPLPAAAPPDVGGDLALADALDLGSELSDALDVGSSEEDPDAPTGVLDDEDALADAEPSRASRRGKTKRRGKTSADDDARPAPAAPTSAAEPDADALLADAKKALASGQARKAYTLASKSRREKKTSAALIVMARAACRYGGEAQAKSAFDQLSLSDRRGIRSECRDHGVRLGL